MSDTEAEPLLSLVFVSHSVTSLKVATLVTMRRTTKRVGTLCAHLSRCLGLSELVHDWVMHIVRAEKALNNISVQSLHLFEKGTEVPGHSAKAAELSSVSGLTCCNGTCVHWDGLSQHSQKTGRVMLPGE